MNSLFILFWIGLAFLMLWSVAHSYLKREWRSTFVSSSLIFGTYCWLLAEILSLFNCLNTFSIAISTLASTSVLIFLFYRRLKNGSIDLSNIRFRFLKENKLIYFLLFILATTFFLAIMYPPNTWDSLTYHLPRVEHWLQNGSLSHYYTNIDRQNFSAPFAEIVILYGRALSGDDRLMNTVQWFSFLGVLIVLSRIAFNLGLSKQMQIVTSLFFATLPMAILQASSTQNDLVVSFFLVCMLDRFLEWNKNKTLARSLEFGIALGLAFLSKGTAYTIALPIVLVYAIICLKEHKKYLLPAVLTALVCITINMPFYVRNFKTYSNPIYARNSTMSSFTFKSFAITSVSNIYVNVPVPLYNGDKIDNISKSVEKDIFPYGPIKVYSLDNWKGALSNSIIYNEDTARNTIHAILILLAIILFLYKRIIDRRLSYFLIVLACWSCFSFCIPWQPWITRLQLPLFAISAPLFALAFNELKNAKMKKYLLLSLCVLSLIPLFMNYTRPLFYIPRTTPILGGRVSTLSIWNTSREKLVYASNIPNYKQIKSYEYISKNDNTKLGLLISGDTWEYPLWRYFRNSDILSVINLSIR